jgi:hypothetical protein
MHETICAMATSMGEWEPAERRNVFRAIGAAGAQVPYKDKAGGSNPSSPTMNFKGQTIVWPFLSSKQVVMRACTNELHDIAVNGVQDKPVAAAPSDMQLSHSLQITA